MRTLCAIILLSSLHVAGQEIKVEYDKKLDLAKYKTFSFGESSVTVASNQKEVADATFDKWIRNGVQRELEYKKMEKVDSLADLVVTYALVRTRLLDIEANGPFGMTPGSADRTWSRNYTQSTLIIDLNVRGGFMVWRVKAEFDVAGRNAESIIDMIIARGFKKYRKGSKKKHQA